MYLKTRYWRLGSLNFVEFLAKQKNQSLWLPWNDNELIFIGCDIDSLQTNSTRQREQLQENVCS